MTVRLVRGGDVLTPAGWAGADLVVGGGRISSVLPRTAASVDPGAGHDLGGGRTLDAGGLLVVPGFVDLQCNGAGGIDLTTEPERLWDVAALLPQWGVTAWLPTIVTAPADVRERARAALAAGPPDGWQGATPLGLHLEGPFLAPARRGAHNPAHLRLPDPALVAGWSRAAGVAVVTLAPELPGAIPLVEALAARDVVVSLGHSEATEAEALAAVGAGARAVTHLFNAMPAAHHREPGLAGVALTDRRLTVGLIADGLHVAPRMVDVAARLLGDRLTLVTDAVAALGMPPGPLRLGDVDAISDGHCVRLSGRDTQAGGDPTAGSGALPQGGAPTRGEPRGVGPLAGSVLSLDQAVGNLLACTAGRTDMAAAVAAASTTPARLLGQTPDRGELTPGARADLVVLASRPPPGTDASDRAPGRRPGDDGGHRPQVVATVVGGAVVYERGGGEAGEGSS